MIGLIVMLVGVGVLMSLPTTWVVLRLSRRAGAFDSAPIAGQVKAPARRIPNTGGIGIAAGVLGPMIVAAIGFGFLDAASLPGALEPLREHLPGLKSQLPLGWALILSVLGLHALGLIDDRRPMGPWVKLVIMLVPGLVFAWAFETRLLTLLDGYVGGSWLSVLVTVLWFAAIINAMNFIDNMDGLSGGIAVIAGSMLLIATLLNGQWFVAATCALLVGSVLGFLVFNFPPARIFMGDGGSLVIGLLLAFLTVRTTYTPLDDSSGGWYAVLMPLVILAVPLYDFTSVTLIRLSQGKSPFVGDMQHFSHRIRDRGLGARSTILVIYALTLATGISGVLMTRASPWQALLLGIQVLALVGAIALFEYRSPIRRGEATDD